MRAVRERTPSQLEDRAQLVDLVQSDAALKKSLDYSLAKNQCVARRGTAYFIFMLKEVLVDMRLEVLVFFSAFLMRCDIPLVLVGMDVSLEVRPQGRHMVGACSAKHFAALHLKTMARVLVHAGKRSCSYPFWLRCLPHTSSRFTNTHGGQVLT